MTMCTMINFAEVKSLLRQSSFPLSTSSWECPVINQATPMRHVTAADQRRAIWKVGHLGEVRSRNEWPNSRAIKSQRRCDVTSAGIKQRGFFQKAEMIDDENVDRGAEYDDYDDGEEDDDRSDERIDNFSYQIIWEHPTLFIVLCKNLSRFVVIRTCERRFKSNQQTCLHDFD